MPEVNCKLRFFCYRRLIMSYPKKRKGKENGGPETMEKKPNPLSRYTHSTQAVG